MTTTTTTKKLLLASLLLLNPTISSGFVEIQDVINSIRFLDCDASIYYDELRSQSGDDPSQWTRELLQALVTNNHRYILPERNDTQHDDDIYKAVMDLDQGSVEGSLHLLYSEKSINATPQKDIWDVERLWSYDDNDSNVTTALLTDVHHVRPVNILVAQQKIRHNYGMCDTVASIDSCKIPATSVTDWDTAQDNKIWQPPESVRGEVARALLYVDLRYEELSLEDCLDNNNNNHQVGYLSQLLTWHKEYPPNVKELQRNNRACSRWQGNRNPFVDYPELAELLHGSPKELVSNTRTYASCPVVVIPDIVTDTAAAAAMTMPSATPTQVQTEVPSSCPTGYPTPIPDACSRIGEGSLPFFLVNTRDPDEVILLALEKIEGGIELYLTDHAWNGESLATDVLDEGTVVMTTPPEGIKAGTLFGYGPRPELSDLWTKDSGTFSLGLQGDNIFLYCMNGLNQIRFLSAFSNSGDWKPPQLEPKEYGINTSALPDSLVNSSIALPHLYNYHYDGPRDARISLLRRQILDPQEWQGSNQLRYGIGNVEDHYASSSAAARQQELYNSFALLPMLIALSALTWLVTLGPFQ